jgi:YHS domain-containing protein
MIRWVLNIIVLLLLLRLALRFVLGLFQGLAGPSGASASGRSTTGGRSKLAGALVLDPVCSTYIPRDTAVAVRVGGETRYYCSVTCRDKDTDAGRAQPRMGRAAHG